jgi:putative cofactor-binding repeat protein
MCKFSHKTLGALALALTLGGFNPAFATILISDNNKDGSFSGTDISYGDGSANAVITPLLFISDFGNTKTPADQTQGAGIGYSYHIGGSGSLREIDYTFTNNRKPSDLFPDVNGLRFMLDVIAFGSGNATTTDKASDHWAVSKAPGNPDKRQIQDFNAAPLSPILVSNNGIPTDGGNNCAPAGCTTDFGFEWDLNKLTPGQSWTIAVSLIDNPSLVNGGGRYLQADSVDVAGNTLIVGDPALVPEPRSYVLLAIGLSLLALFAHRRLHGDR